MKTTRYFDATRQRTVRSCITDEWIIHVVRNPAKEVVQSDGASDAGHRSPRADGRFLRFDLLADGQTVHNAFFDRSYSP